MLSINRYTAIDLAVPYIIKQRTRVSIPILTSRRCSTLSRFELTIQLFVRVKHIYSL